MIIASFVPIKSIVNTRPRLNFVETKSTVLVLQARYVINRRNLIEYLNQHPCIDCGETDIVVLEFDHREPSTKRAKIANILGSWNWETVMIEIDKCDVRCANDHRRRTSEQFGWFKGLAEESDVMPDDKDEGLD